MATKFILNDHVIVNDTANQPKGMIGRVVGVNPQSPQTYNVLVDTEGKILWNVAETVLVGQ